MTNWHGKRDGNLIVLCFNLIYFVIFPAGIQFIGRKRLFILLSFGVINRTDITTDKV